jgi:hypothetical protein
MVIAFNLDLVRLFFLYTITKAHLRAYKLPHLKADQGKGNFLTFRLRQDKERMKDSR